MTKGESASIFKTRQRFMRVYHPKVRSLLFIYLFIFVTSVFASHYNSLRKQWMKKLKLSVYVLLLSHIWLFIPPQIIACQGCSVCGIFQARILELVTIFSFRKSSQPRGQTCISCGFFTTAPPGKPMNIMFQRKLPHLVMDIINDNTNS